MDRIISSTEVVTALEMVNELGGLLIAARVDSESEGQKDRPVVYVIDAVTGAPVKLALRKNTLTDGSFTYDVLVGGQ